jgi:hypothetical protein
MKYLRFSICLAAALAVSPAGFAQSGFPFTDETLHYNINWPSGLSLGEAVFTAHHNGGGNWDFDLNVNAAVPGYAVVDHYLGSATSDLCSLSLLKDSNHGGKKTTEKTTFDQAAHTAHRVTTTPSNGGDSTVDIAACARDAMTYVYYGRRELGQGRVPQPQTVYFGAAYNVKMTYTGAQNITYNGKQTVTDHLTASVQGPRSNFTFEVFYARDAQRSPLKIRIPLPVGALSVDLTPTP